MHAFSLMRCIFNPCIQFGQIKISFSKNPCGKTLVLRRIYVFGWKCKFVDRQILLLHCHLFVSRSTRVPLFCIIVKVFSFFPLTFKWVILKESFFLFFSYKVYFKIKILEIPISLNIKWYFFSFSGKIFTSDIVGQGVVLIQYPYFLIPCPFFKSKLLLNH